VRIITDFFTQCRKKPRLHWKSSDFPGLKEGKVVIIRAVASVNSISITVFRTKNQIPKSRIGKRNDELY
jgi:hypothetical protein